MNGRRLVVLLTSAVLHVAALGGALVMAGTAVGPAIVVDLVADVVGDAVHEVRSRAIARATSPRTARVQNAPAALVPPAVAPDASGAQGPPMIPEARHEAPPVMPSASSAEPTLVESAPSLANLSRQPSAPAPRSAEPGAAVHAVAGAGTGPTSGDAHSRLAGSGETATRPGSDAPVALATSDGRGGIPPEYGPYLERFRRRVQETVHYPLTARRQGVAGTVELEVLLEPTGRIGAARVIASSSHPMLDEAALEAVRRLSAEPIPDALPRRPLRIRLPLAFELR